MENQEYGILTSFIHELSNTTSVTEYCYLGGAEVARPVIVMLDPAFLMVSRCYVSHFQSTII